MRDKEKEREKCREYFLSDPFSYEKLCVFISTHCNTNVNIALIVMNNIRKELVMIAVHYEN